jgi:hypothetical protein
MGCSPERLDRVLSLLGGLAISFDGPQPFQVRASSSYLAQAEMPKSDGDWPKKSRLLR